jgi:hypothetical protein
MTKAIRLIVAVAALVLLAPAPGQAGSKPGTGTTVVLIEEGVFTPDFCLEFPLLTPAGAPLGHGRACITGGDFSCFPVPYAGCQQTTSSTFEFTLPGGSVTASMKLRELFLDESTLVQFGTGRIIDGTGAYAGARGQIVGGGLLNLTDEGFEGRLIYFVRAR